MTYQTIKGDNIVSITPIRQQALFGSIGRVESYWEGLRDDRLMPSRAEIDPRGISDALEYAFILEKIAPGLARIRLSGMHLNALMAMEVRGMPITAMFLPEARREMQRVLAAVLDQPAAIRLSLEGDGGPGRSRLYGQMILLPLRDDTGRPSRVLGALQTRGEIGAGPRRFRIRDIETKLLLGDPLPQPRQGASAQDRPGQETPAPSRSAFRELANRLSRKVDGKSGRTDTARSHLRLVYDADLA